MKLQFVHTWDGNDYATNTDSASVSLNAWHHIVVTYNADATGNEAEKGTGLHAGVNLTENTEEGVGPTFPRARIYKAPQGISDRVGFPGGLPGFSAILEGVGRSHEWSVRSRGSAGAGTGSGKFAVNKNSRKSGPRAVHRRSLVRELFGPDFMPHDGIDPVRDFLGGGRRSSGPG